MHLAIYLLTIMCYETPKQRNNNRLKEVEMSTAQELNQESKYDILQNEEGEILIIINSRAGGPEDPRFVYDGGETALLYRSKESAVVFKDIAKEARIPLKSVTTMLIVEVEDEDVAREYVVPVRVVKDIKSYLK